MSLSSWLLNSLVLSKFKANERNHTPPQNNWRMCIFLTYLNRKLPAPEHKTLLALQNPTNQKPPMCSFHSFFYARGVLPVYVPVCSLVIHFPLFHFHWTSGMSLIQVAVHLDAKSVISWKIIRQWWKLCWKNSLACVHSMGRSVLHLKLISFNELHFKLTNVVKDIL